MWRDYLSFSRNKQLFFKVISKNVKKKKVIVTVKAVKKGSAKVIVTAGDYKAKTKVKVKKFIHIMVEYLFICL